MVPWQMSRSKTKQLFSFWLNKGTWNRNQKKKKKRVELSWETDVPGWISSLMSWIWIPWPKPLTMFSHWSPSFSVIFSFIFFLIVTTAFTCIPSSSMPEPDDATELFPFLSLLSNEGDVVVVDVVWLLSPPLTAALTSTLRRSEAGNWILRRRLMARVAGDGRRERSEGRGLSANIMGWRMMEHYSAVITNTIICMCCLLYHPLFIISYSFI